MITGYTSDCYLGPRTDFLFRTLVVAFGEIHGVRYVFSKFYDEERVPPGTVPDEFVEEAMVAFERAELDPRRGAPMTW